MADLPSAKPLAPLVALPDRQSFALRLRRGTVVLLVALAVPALLLLALVIYLLRAADWVDHADRVIAGSYLVEKLMVDMETGLRGFQVTDQDRFLEPYNKAKVLIDRQQSELAGLVANRPSDATIVATLLQETSAWRAYANEALARPRGVKVDPEFVLRGKTLMDGIRARIGSLIGEQERLRTERNHTLDQIATVLLALLATAALAGIPSLTLWLRRLLHASNTSYEASLLTVERRSEELNTTLRSIGDAVLATDATGAVAFINPEAERLTGWSDAEAKGRPMVEVLPIFNEQTGEPAENPVERVLRERIVVGLANHTVLRRRGGGEIPIEDSAAPIFHTDGSIRGVILVFHDVTEKHARDRALQRAEWLSRTALEVAGAGAFAWEMVSDRVTADENTGRLFAINPTARKEGLPISAYFAAILPEYLAQVQAAITHSIETGQDYQTEYRVRAEGGLERWVNVRGRMELDAARKPARLVGFVQDTTERRETETELRERERFATLRAEVAAQISTATDLDCHLQGVSELIVTHLNAAFARIWTLDEPSATLHLRASAGLYTDLDGPHARVPMGEFKIGRIAATRLPLLSNDAAHDPNISGPSREERDGMRGFAGYPLIAEGKLVGVFAIFSRQPFSEAVLGDLVPLCENLAQCIERKEADVELRNSKERAEVALQAAAEGTERFRLLAETVSLQVWTAQPDGALDWANHYVASYFGVTDVEREVLGTAWTQLVHPDDLPEAGARWAQAVATGERYETEFRLRRADGEYRWFLVRAEAMRDETGAIKRWFGTNTEVHEMKTARQNAEIAGRAKDNFLATLSHELRTPLTPVLMTAAALRQDERLPNEVRDDLAMIERNIALEALLIDDLLDLTRIAKGKLQLREEICDVHTLIGLAVEIVRDEAQSKPVLLKLALSAQRSGLQGDPARLQQVFWNLLRNAIKFTPKGGSVTIRTQDTDANRLLIEVVDTGVGIVPESLEKVFRPFEQAEREGDHRSGGLGLGLAIARAIVDLHGGQICAESAGAGQGSTFSVELPGATEQLTGATDAGVPLNRDGSSQHDAEPASSLRLLLVEDHEPTVAVLSRLLTRAGHNVVTAGTVAAAVATAKSLPFDVVISDLGLPDGTGLEAIGKLRAIQPGVAGIALSGYGMEDDLQRSLDAGFFIHLIKPVDFERLRRALRDVSRKISKS